MRSFTLVLENSRSGVWVMRTKDPTNQIKLWATVSHVGCRWVLATAHNFLILLFYILSPQGKFIYLFANIVASNAIRNDFVYHCNAHDSYITIYVAKTGSYDLFQLTRLEGLVYSFTLLLSNFPLSNRTKPPFPYYANLVIYRYIHNRHVQVR